MPKLLTLPLTSLGKQKAPPPPTILSLTDGSIDDGVAHTYYLSFQYPPGPAGPSEHSADGYSPLAEGPLSDPVTLAAQTSTVGAVISIPKKMPSGAIALLIYRTAPNYTPDDIFMIAALETLDGTGRYTDTFSDGDANNAFSAHNSVDDHDDNSDVLLIRRSDGTMLACSLPDGSLYVPKVTTDLATFGVGGTSKILDRTDIGLTVHSRQGGLKQGSVSPSGAYTQLAEGGNSSESGIVGPWPPGVGAPNISFVHSSPITAQAVLSKGWVWIDMTTGDIYVSISNSGSYSSANWKKVTLEASV